MCMLLKLKSIHFTDLSLKKEKKKKRQRQTQDTKQRTGAREQKTKIWCKWQSVGAAETEQKEKGENMYKLHTVFSTVVDLVQQVQNEFQCFGYKFVLIYPELKVQLLT